MESYTNVIHAKNLEIGYDTVLSKVSFLLQKKDRLAIIGENGKGKSTLLKTLVGELPALGGEFSFGQNVEWSYFDQRCTGGIFIFRRRCRKEDGTAFRRRESTSRTL